MSINVGISKNVGFLIRSIGSNLNKMLFVSLSICQPRQQLDLSASISRANNASVNRSSCCCRGGGGGGGGAFNKFKDGTKNVAATCTIKQMSAIIFHIIVYTSFLTPCISFSFRATITANGCNFLLLLSRHLEIHFLRRRRQRRPKKHFAVPSPVLLEPSFLSGLPISTLGQNVYLNSAPNQPHIRMISDKSNCLPPSTLHLYCRAAAAAAEHAVCVFGCLALTLTDAPLECRCLCLLLLLLLLLLLSLLLLLAFKPPETHHQDLFVHVNPLLPNYEKIRRRKEVRCRPSLMTPFVVSATMQCSSKKDGGTVQTYWS
jgi:hypothetical protein